MRNIFIITLTFAVAVFAQSRSGTITGKLVNSGAVEPVEFANIILFNQTDSSQVTGTTTDEKGQFVLTNVKAGNYYLEARFIGYENKSVKNISGQRSKPITDLGSIRMEPTIIAIEGVAIEAERAAITYEIDRTVIEVSKMETAASGTAIEVLENVPSVTVDIEGNVALRGSSNFKLLINGRPTVMDANDALQQTPAGSIDKIEVITNPSSKHDPDGTTGIINLKLEENENLGRSALVNLNGGMNEKYGADLLYQYRTDRINYLVGFDANHRMYSGDGYQERRTTVDNKTSFVDSYGDSERGF